MVLLRFHYRFHKSPGIGSNPEPDELVHSLTASFPKIHFNIVLPSPSHFPTRVKIWGSRSGEHGTASTFTRSYHILNYKLTNSAISSVQMHLTTDLCWQKHGVRAHSDSITGYAQTMRELDATQQGSTVHV